MGNKRRVFTVGHGNRSWEDFWAVLQGAGVQQVVDVRRYPRSRRWPHFNREALAAALARQGVGYHWLGEALGGYAQPPYPAYMQTEAFARGLAHLEALAARQPTAVLCAERDWRRCHRRFIADALCARGWQVVHLLKAQRHEPHPCPLTDLGLRPTDRAP